MSVYGRIWERALMCVCVCVFVSVSTATVSFFFFAPFLRRVCIVLFLPFLSSSTPLLFSPSLPLPFPDLNASRLFFVAVPSLYTFLSPSFKLSIPPLFLSPSLPLILSLVLLLSLPLTPSLRVWGWCGVRVWTGTFKIYIHKKPVLLSFTNKRCNALGGRWGNWRSSSPLRFISTCFESDRHTAERRRWPILTELLRVVTLSVCTICKATAKKKEKRWFQPKGKEKQKCSLLFPLFIVCYFWSPHQLEPYSFPRCTWQGTVEKKRKKRQNEKSG